MSDPRPKDAVLAALHCRPDCSLLAGLGQLGSRRQARFLRWLDQSGLALLFLDRVRSLGALHQLPVALGSALLERQARNKLRLGDMLAEFQRLRLAFHSRGVFAATLKGFSLIPDFCSDASLRHQTDFDFLVAPHAVEAAAAALASCGYSCAKVSRTGESYFTTPLLHLPAETDDLYAVQPHRQVDLHVSLCEKYPWLEIDVPGDCLEHVEPLTVEGQTLYSLSLEDRFVGQVLHAFRHLFRSWLRLSWLFEISRCLTVHAENRPLWTRVIERAGPSLLTRRIFFLVLGACSRLSGAPLPDALQSWSVRGRTPSLQAWLDHFSLAWMTADWPGSLNNLFLVPDFLADGDPRRQYLRSRLLPGRVQTSLGSLAAGARHSPLRIKAAQLRYVVRRTAAHSGDILRLPAQQWRWRKALRGESLRAANSELKLPASPGGVS